MNGRPLPGEYGEHAEPDIARVEGDDAVEALLRQQREFEALLARLDESRIAGLRYAPGKWTVKEVIGHMLDDERIFAYRMLCIARGDTKPLESFDENVYVAGANFEERSLASFIEEYRLIRASTVALLRSLTKEAWLRRATVTDYTASVRGLAWHIAGHELHHIEILQTRYGV
ncbi:MAG TPA: DinB family protein [Thermoanaerobaculia bacterium]|nr:DinB family protein [Thermoanaerobaculia bacterium]